MRSLKIPRIEDDLPGGWVVTDIFVVNERGEDGDEERAMETLIVPSFETREKSNYGSHDFFNKPFHEGFIKSRPRHCVSRTAAQTEGILLVYGEGGGGDLVAGGRRRRRRRRHRPMKTFHPGRCR